MRGIFEESSCGPKVCFKDRKLALSQKKQINSRYMCFCVPQCTCTISRFFYHKFAQFHLKEKLNCKHGKHDLQHWVRATKGQLNSEWNNEVIVSPKIPAKNYQDFCPRTLLEILVIFGWHFGRNDDLINSFWI